MSWTGCAAITASPGGGGACGHHCLLHSISAVIQVGTHGICVAVGGCRDALQGLEMGEIPRFDDMMIFFLNKDHQRMMVDPMFMIIQSLRLFLTAVIPTAVAPIAVV